MRFIGVTGHGLSVAAMHLRSLERFAFDSVLLPYSHVIMQDEQYAADFEALLGVCARAQRRGADDQGHRARAVGLEGALRRRPGTSRSPSRRDIDLAVHWVLGEPGVFLNSAGDLELLPARPRRGRALRGTTGRGRHGALAVRGAPELAVRLTAHCTGTLPARFATDT